MTDNVDYLPIWKKNATAEEKLMELAIMARKNPECFTQLMVIYQEENEHGFKTRYACDSQSSSIEMLGLIELGKAQLLRNIYGDD